MEPNLQKFITSSHLSVVPSHFQLSSVPSQDFINPGVGQICQMYSFYKPLFQSQKTYTISKTTESLEKEGKGKFEEDELPSEDNDLNEDSSSESKEDKS